jgi:hypothetical protein
LKVELNDQERWAVARLLAERKTRLIERAGDTTQTPAARQSALLERAAISSVLRKLRSKDRRNHKLNITDGGVTPETASTVSADGDRRANAWTEWRHDGRTKTWPT